jgi:PAS domain S-box-containing protein/putative nucleotidyltransferase with HDIG domain
MPHPAIEALTSVELTTSGSSHIYEFCWAYARDAMILADCRTGRMVDLNPAAERLTGYFRHELIGRHYCRLHPQAERGSLQNAFRAVASRQESFEGFHALRKDGVSVPVSISTSKPFAVDGRLLVLGIFRDQSEIEEHAHSLAIKTWALEAYGAAAIALSRARSSSGLMQEICEAITRNSVFLLAWVGFAEEGPEKFIRMVGAAGPALHYIDGMDVSWSEDKVSGQGPTGIALRTNTVQVLGDMETSEIFRPWRERARQVGIRSSVTIPFQVEGYGLGALMVYASLPHAFESVALDTFTHLVEEIGHGLEKLSQKERLDAERLRHEDTQRELAAALSAIVGALTATMEVRDPYTAGHEGRVAEIACAIAREMGWSEHKVHGLWLAAMVHDIGKISIPAEILNKEGALLPSESLLIREHPQTGYDILKHVPFKWPVAVIVRQHHEKLNGSGYPLGLKGDAILPEAKVLAVADIVEAMSSARPYRAALGLDAALEEIERQSGTLLDAEGVQVCMTLFRENRLSLPGLRRR